MASNNEITIALDRAGRHRLRLTLHGSDGATAFLEADPEQRHSPLRHALLEHLVVAGERLQPTTRSLKISEPVAVIKVGAVILADIDIAAGEHRISPTTLSPFESRYLADNRRPFEGRVSVLPDQPVISDLHSHFAGCVTPSDLIDIGVETGA